MSEPNRLVKHFTKPEPGEYVPITFIEMAKETVAWSPRVSVHPPVGANLKFYLS